MRLLEDTNPFMLQKKPEVMLQIASVISRSPLALRYIPKTCRLVRATFFTKIGKARMTHVIHSVLHCYWTSASGPICINLNGFKSGHTKNRICLKEQGTTINCFFGYWRRIGQYVLRINSPSFEMKRVPRHKLQMDRMYA